jgi:hypothetical protein
MEDHGMIRKEEPNKHNKATDTSGNGGTSDNKTMLEPSPQHLNKKRRTRTWICHHCKRKGHIRPFCYKLMVIQVN